MASRRFFIAGAGTLVLALLAFAAWRAGDIRHSATGRVQGSPGVDGMTASPQSGVDHAASDLPISLRGTQTDGGVRFDAAGRPVTDAELRRYFDWYLAAIGEQPLPAIRARLAHDVSRGMTNAQAAIVLDWFDRYVAYLRASTQLADIADLQQRLDAVHNLRRRMLGETAAQGFFGEEENEAARVLALKQSRADPALDVAERRALEQGLQAGSPGYAEAVRDAALRQELRALDEQLASQGASDNQRHAERSALLGVEAADRFAELDRARAEWEGRLRAYSRQRAALQSRGLTASQRQAELQRLLAAFSPAEQRRLIALQEAGLLP